MRNIAVFAVRLVNKCVNDNLFELANGLAYRILLAFFPFLVFLLSLTGFLNLDNSVLLENLYAFLPPDISAVVNRFFTEANVARSTGLLGTSLFFSVYNTANGFRAVVRSINKAYGYKDKRGVVAKTGVSLLMMLIFTVTIILMLALLVFGNHLWTLINSYLPDNLEQLYSLISALGSMVALSLTTMLIYKLAVSHKTPLMQVFPGAIVTVLLWVISSKVFSYLIARFSSYSVIYGSIAGVFTLILWLNLISLILLIGNEINSMLSIE